MENHVSEEARAKTGFAEVNGAKLYYEVAGQGFPLLLIHAGVGDSRMWADQWDEFAAHYRVIGTDLRGFGGTVVPPGLFSYHEDLAGVLRFLQLIWCM